VLFWSIGALMAGFGVHLFDVAAQPMQPSPTRATSAQPEQAVQPTFVINVQAELVAPSPTTTTTPSATDTPIVVTMCGTAEPGKLCKVPFPAPPTPTPYPDCKDIDHMEPGDWCIWPSPTVVSKATPAINPLS
jgi:hypothetical protein